MKQLFLLLTLVAAILVACTGVVLAQQNSSERSSPSAQKSSAHLAPSGGTPKPLCPEPKDPNQSRCLSQKLTGVKTARSTSTPDFTPSGYWPSDLQSAYNLTNDSSTGGEGMTVAIVDAFHDPTAFDDLLTYRDQFGLTCDACTFEQVDQNGGTNYPPYDQGWAGEIALDIDMVSAICPNCNILLVETDDNFDENLDAGVDEAANLGANVISNSWSNQDDLSVIDREPHFNHPGIAITAATGDDGYADGPQYPATSTLVTAVGGTSLFNVGGQWSETAWSGAGSGCSTVISKPPWQSDPDCNNRTEADVSAMADPNTGAAVYDSNNGGWIQVGGTSAATPIIGAVYALAGNTGFISDSSYPYYHTDSLFDVTSGSNGICAAPASKKAAKSNKTVSAEHHKKGKKKHHKKHHSFFLPPQGGPYLCNAVPGYDGPTGLGTPNGTGAF